MEKAVTSSGGGGGGGPKVSQIATIFQKKPVDVQPEPIKEAQTTVQVVRTESHAARFNNARALFEKLGVENTGVLTSAFSVKLPHSNSRENFIEENPDLSSPPLKHKQYTANITNGGSKMESTKIINFRSKSEKPEKPEKPERKFNSKELIEKQKNWTSHFTKTRTARFNSDPNRCDIIRTVQGTNLYSGNITQPAPPHKTIVPPPKLPSLDSPPSPPIRQPPPPPPEIKPRNLSKAATSPTKVPPPVNPFPKPQNYTTHSPTKNLPSATDVQKNNSSPAKKHEEQTSRKKSINDASHYDSNNCHKHSELARRPSTDIDKTSNGVYSPAHGISSSPSPAPSASSGPSSPNHTEDEKQENEENEKLNKIDEDMVKKACQGRTSSSPPSDYDQTQNVTKRSTKVSSICLNIPAAGLGSRPPSIISSVSADEGGFNEPLPEIKAISQKPEPPKPPPHSPPRIPSFDEKISSPPPVPVDYDDDPKLNYVDVGYRLESDGCEAKEIFGESELYNTCVIKNSVLEELEKEERLKNDGFNRPIYSHHRNTDNVIYATIKPEIPPPTELLLNNSFNGSASSSTDYDNDFDSSEKSYHSPQTILDPTRPTLVGDENSSATGLPPIPARPPLPEGPPLDLHDVEFADASDNEGTNDSLPDA